MLPITADMNFAVRLPILVSRLRLTQRFTVPYVVKDLGGNGPQIRTAWGIIQARAFSWNTVPLVALLCALYGAQNSCGTQDGQSACRT